MTRYVLKEKAREIAAANRSLHVRLGPSGCTSDVKLGRAITTEEIDDRLSREKLWKSSAACPGHGQVMGR